MKTPTVIGLAALMLWLGANVSGYAETLTDTIKIVEAEATYTMGDSDTLASAEENVLLRAKRKAVESVGVYLETLSTDIETSTAEQTKHLHSLSVRTLGAALTETQVLDKRRSLEDGRVILSIKIRTKVHIDWLRDAVQRLHANEQLAEHHRQLHAEYNQLRAELDKSREQIKANEMPGRDRTVVAMPNRRAARDLVRSAVETHSLPDKIDLATRAISADEKYVDAYVVRGQTYLRIASLNY